MQKIPQSRSKIFKSVTLGGKTYPIPHVKGKSIRFDKGKAFIEGENKEVVVDLESGKVENYGDKIRRDFGEYWENSATYVKAVRVAIAIPAIIILAIKEVLGWIVSLLDEVLRILASISTGGRV